MADSGGGVFKLIAVFGGGEPVNSFENSLFLLCFEADESPENVRSVCKGIIDEVTDFCKKKNIEVKVGGDYKILKVKFIRSIRFFTMKILDFLWDKAGGRK